MKTNIAMLTFLICIVMVTTAVKAADVNLPNGDFSGGTYVGRGGNVMPVLWDNANNRIDGSWGAPADEDYNNGGYVIAEVNGTGTPSGGYAVVFQVSNMSLASVGIPDACLPISDFTISADINDLIPGGGGPGAILKLECYNNLDGGTPNLITTPAEEYQIAVSGSTWANYRQIFTSIPLATKSIKVVFGISTGWGSPNLNISKFAFDNLRIGFWYYGTTPSLFPVPIMGAVRNPDNKVISWTNPQGAVNADVYLQESTGPNPSPNPRVNGTRIAHNTDAQSLTVSSIQNQRYYYWVVDVNMGDYVVPGFIWDFQTNNLNVNAGADQYLVVTASPKTLIFNATVTSDNAIATYAWTNITADADKDPLTDVNIVSPTTEDTNVTLTNTDPNRAVNGWYQFNLTVTDVNGNIATDNVAVGVYSTCAAAAIADPNDNYDGTGDLNGDCKVDLHDFATFASKWLSCDSLRRACP
jgi:hypothetical protein